MKNRFFKVMFLFTIFTFFSCIIYADDELDENDVSIQEISESIAEVSSNIEKSPQINARHAVVIDRYSERVLYGKKEKEKCKMASTTKIMTAIIVLENSNLKDIVHVSKKAAQTGGSKLGLSSNDKITVENLLYGLMMKSGNDAAVALAEHVEGNIENFANLMNKKAKSLNLNSTNFVTPHGLDDDNHYTTAYDLAILTDYALKNKTFSKIVNTKNYTILINNVPKTLSNTNELLGNYNGIYGVKTGFTNGANRCLVTACKRGNLDVICVVLGCDTKKYRSQDSIKLLNYISSNFCMANVKNILDSNFENWYFLNKDNFTIYKGIFDSFNLYLNKDDFKFSSMAVKKSDLKNIKTDIVINSHFEAPVNSNSTVGCIVLKLNDCSLYKVNIMNYNEIPRKNILNYAFEIFKHYSSFFTTKK